ncbi:sodium-coupled neutral amino acid transporter 9 homolog [Diadema antillarum]|uniref:sodium-coupled neutral amino acid transporter 9 homolog n=1 Tax=Diadema antillarum TaxID=105358 RepID=UPI003A8513AF
MSFKSETPPRDSETGEKTPLLDDGEDISNGVARKDSIRGSPGSNNLSGVSQGGADRKRRRPFHHSSIPTYPSDQGNIQHPADARVAATYNRYRYYSRLSQHNTGHFDIPDHVVPTSLFVLVSPFVKKESGAKQNSIVTIFSIWNTMMGTSLLSMPWALQQAGFAMGLVLMLVMAALALYTCYRVMQSVERIQDKVGLVEFSDVCKKYLGRWGEKSSVFFSLSALLGAMIVYWVLMSNFLYSTVFFVFQEVMGIVPASNDTALCYGSPAFNRTVLFLLEDPSNKVTNTTPAKVALFHRVWSETGTVPLFLCFLILPLIHIKSPTFFTKFNSLGTLSVAFLLIYVCVRAAKWGIHIDFNNVNSDEYVQLFHWRFPSLSGLLALGYFIHNAISAITQNQAHPENNGRDLTIAYFLVAFTYIFVAVVFYISFPLPKECIADNFLKNFFQGDAYAFAARLFLLFQMVTLFPLLVYITRVQLMDQLFGKAFPSWKHMIIFNLILVTICVLFAMFLPHIGNIIRYSGAFCGMAYIFTLPVVVYLLFHRNQGTLRWYHVVLHSVLVAVGVANFISQFLV